MDYFNADYLDKIRKGEIINHYIGKALENYPNEDVIKAIIEGINNRNERMKKEMENDPALREIYEILISENEEVIEALESGKPVVFGGVVVQKGKY